MNAIEKIEKLRQEFFSLNTEEQKKKFDTKFRKNISSKAEEDKKVFADAFIQSAKKASEKANDLCDAIDIRLKLGKVLDMVSMSYIAQNYFNKSKSWFSQRMNGHIVNGSPTYFTKEELLTLSAALNDISKQINETARSIA